MATMDICIVAGQRPDLLRKTLESFAAGLFQHFDIATCYANIDPIFGDRSQGDAAENVVKDFFPNADVHRPQTPQFCTAIKHLWRASRSDVIFHLEDDWVLNQNLKPADILPFFETQSIAQVSLNHVEKQWDFTKGPFQEKDVKRRFLGLSFKTGKKFPCFTTSPSFIRGEFARNASVFLDERYDPEKQFYKGVNQQLERYVSPYRNYLYGQGRPFVITDAGRDWRDARNISKTIINHTSVWETTTGKDLQES